MQTISQVSGIQLHYARTNQHPYGTMGKPHAFLMESIFAGQLRNCFDELFEDCPLGKPNAVTCGGTFVPKPGMHGQGKAFDLDGLFWDDFSFVTISFYHEKELYLAIESFLRLHFGIVLNYFYNDSHKDHWHFDNSMAVDYNTASRSSTLYIQLVSAYIYEYPVVIDGIYGPQTQGAIDYMLQKLQLSGSMTSSNTYKAFLKKTGKIAFKKFELTKTPLHLFNTIYEVVADLGLNPDNKLRIHQALNSFRQHDDTAQWLDQFRIESDIEDIINSMV